MKKIIIFCLIISIASSYYMVKLYNGQKTEKPVVREAQASLVGYSKLELCGESELIIKGTVQKILPSKWSYPDSLKKEEKDRFFIQTDIVIDIDKTYKGLPYDNKEIKIRTDKGQIGNLVYKNDSDANFENGEDVILFLQKDTSWLADPYEDYYILTGRTQGKFKNTGKDGNKDIYENSIGYTLDLSSIKEEIKAGIEYSKLKPKFPLSAEKVKEQNEKLFGK